MSRFQNISCFKHTFSEKMFWTSRFWNNLCLNIFFMIWMLRLWNISCFERNFSKSIHVLNVTFLKHCSNTQNPFVCACWSQFQGIFELLGYLGRFGFVRESRIDRFSATSQNAPLSPYHAWDTQKIANVASCSSFMLCLLFSTIWITQGKIMVRNLFE